MIVTHTSLLFCILFVDANRANPPVTALDDRCCFVAVFVAEIADANENDAVSRVFFLRRTRARPEPLPSLPPPEATAAALPPRSPDEPSDPDAADALTLGDGAAGGGSIGIDDENSAFFDALDDLRGLSSCDESCLASLFLRRRDDDAKEPAGAPPALVTELDDDDCCNGSRAGLDPIDKLLAFGDGDARSCDFLLDVSSVVAAVAAVAVATLAAAAGAGTEGARFEFDATACAAVAPAVAASVGRRARMRSMSSIDCTPNASACFFSTRSR